MKPWILVGTVVAVSSFLPCAGANAQTFETVGTRALGMGGAFVAVADDASATWWNPAGLATGSTVDVIVARQRLDTRSEADDLPPAARRGGTAFALSMPALGISYYRLRFTEIRPSDPTAEGVPGRQDGGTEVPVQAVGVSQVGITVLQTLVPGLHVGSTLKYVSAGATVASLNGSGRAGDLLDSGSDLEIERHGAFDLDLGLMANLGALRIGATARNVRRPEFATTPSEGHASPPVARLDRLLRAGVAVDVAAAGGPPLIVALDMDLRRVATAFGDRRNLALGAEQWLAKRRVGVRGGFRVNTAGEARPVAAAGLSVAAKSGLYLEAQATGGGQLTDRGWGIGGRVTF